MPAPRRLPPTEREYAVEPPLLPPPESIRRVLSIAPNRQAIRSQTIRKTLFVDSELLSAWAHIERRARELLQSSTEEDAEPSAGGFA